MRRILIIFVSLLITVGAAYFFSSKSEGWLDSFRESKAHVLVSGKAFDIGENINKSDLVFREVKEDEKIPYGVMIFIPEKTTSSKDFIEEEKEKVFKWVSGKVTKRKLEKDDYIRAEDLITFDESNRLNNSLVLVTVEDINIGDSLTPFNVIPSSMPKDQVEMGSIILNYNESIDDFLIKYGDLRFTSNLSQNSVISFTDIVNSRTVAYFTKGEEPVKGYVDPLDKGVYFVELTKDLFEKRKAQTKGFLPLRKSDLSSVVSLPGTRMDLYLGSLSSNTELTRYEKIASDVKLYSYKNIEEESNGINSSLVYWTLINEDLARKVKQSRSQGVRLVAIPADSNFIDYQEGFSFCKGDVCMKQDLEEDDIFDENVEENGLKPLSDVDVLNLDSSKEPKNSVNIKK